MRNTITYRLRAAKSKFFTEKLCSYKSSPRLFWKSINDITGRVRIASGQLPSVDALNRQFNSVVGTSSSNVTSVSCSVSLNAHDCSTTAGSSFCNFPFFSVEEVCSLLEHLNTNKASGSDGIDAIYLKLGSKAIAPSLSGIFNRSLTTGIFPSEWKIARVTPVFKSGSRSDPANYRPVSLLPIVSKLLEKRVFEALNHHFESNSILPDCQFGFRKARSTVDAVSVLENDLLTAKDRRLHSGAVFLDVRKAFDTVDHHLLLSKLAKEGVGGVVLRWFHSYLSGRRQFVKVGGESSLSTPVVRGVPQGSKLGPLLFNFYTADLPRAVPSVCSIILYADDACIYMSDNSLDGVVKSLQEGVNSTANWYRENLMSLNGRKSNLLLFPKFRNKSCLSNYKLSVDSAQLLPSPSAKYLGIFFDSQLNWKVHVDSVVRKVSRKIGVLYRCYRFLNTSARLALVKSVIQPDMDYAWSSDLE